jgi:phage recombination protein Bet
MEKAIKPAKPAKKELKEASASEKKEIQVIERVIESKEIAPQDAFGKLSRPQVELIKRTIAKGATDDELNMFIQVCKGSQLNPFLRQVHLVKRWDNKRGGEVATIQVGIDGFRSIAESSGVYAGNDDAIFEGENIIKIVDGKVTKDLIVPAKAMVTVYKVVQGQRYPFTATARWDEYYPGDKQGFMWRVKPHIMLGKCAEALALRKAFPKLLSGMYAPEEMDQGIGQENQNQQQLKGFQTLMKVISTASLEEVKNWQTKMEKSDKYTKEQKAEFNDKVEVRLKELAK